MFSRTLLQLHRPPTVCCDWLVPRQSFWLPLLEHPQPWRWQVAKRLHRTAHLQVASSIPYGGQKNRMGDYGVLTTQGTRNHLSTILNSPTLIIFKCIIMLSSGLLRTCFMSLPIVLLKDQSAGFYSFWGRSDIWEILKIISSIYFCSGQAGGDARLGEGAADISHSHSQNEKHSSLPFSKADESASPRSSSSSFRFEQSYQNQATLLKNFYCIKEIQKTCMNVS